MKKILIVDVPEDFLCEDTKYQVIALNPAPDEIGWFAKDCDFTEYTPPSDEEIIKVAKHEYLYMEKQAAFRKGVYWFKSLLS